jgi:hypothetical protein
MKLLSVTTSRLCGIVLRLIEIYGLFVLILYVHHIIFIILGHCAKCIRCALVLRYVNLLEHVDAIPTKNFVIKATLIINHFLGGDVGATTLRRATQNLPVHSTSIKGS